MFFLGVFAYAGGGTAAGAGTFGSFAGAAAFFGSAGLAGYYLNEFFDDSSSRKGAYATYKAFQRKGYNRSNDPCQNLKNRIKFREQLADMRGAFDQQYPHSGFPEGKHTDLIAQDRIEIEKLKKMLKEMCPDECN